MLNKTDNSTTCQGCGAELEEDNSSSPEDRTPCPKCGSTKRNFTLRAEMGSYSLTFGNITLTHTRASFLLQAVVEFGEKTNEGKLIEAVSLPWFEIIQYLKKNPEAAFRIPAHKWEEIIAGAYKKAGFEEVTLTPRSGDFGRDIIAVKKGLGTIRVIDQVKAYSPNHLVDANDVRALMGVLQTDGASKGFVTTTSDFAPKLRIDPLITPYMPSRLELINGEQILKGLIELQNK